jgi:hypothetical protein
MMAFALVAQPLYGFVSAQIVNAATITDHVVINEIMAKPTAGGSEWIELYNPTNNPVNISGWKLKTGSRTFSAIANSDLWLSAHGFYVALPTVGGENLSDSSQTITLLGKTGNDAIDAVPYSGIAEGKSYSRIYDAADTWVAQATPSKGVSNGSVSVVIPVKTPAIVAENFNTNSDSAYDGVSVGFNVNNFEDVKSVTVKLIREDDSHVTKTAGPPVLNIINDDGKETLSTPFVIKSGTFAESGDKDSEGDLYWNPANAVTWTSATRPKNAIVEITNGDNTLHVLDFSVAGKTFTEPDMVTYESITPILPPAQVDEIVRASTAVAENAPGWLFNRDSSTSTPYEFKAGVHSLGSGSLYVAPIGGVNPQDKFIGELFAKTPVSDFSGLSYDFKIAGNGTATSAEHFYTSVYVNAENDNKFYDCRFDYAPVSGSTDIFTSFSFDKSSLPTHVQTSGTSRVGACPATMAEMPAGSYVRMLAMNIGQSTASDAGLAGYFDNVIFSTKSKVTTYDFEADMVAPSVPINGMPNATYERDNEFDFTWSKSADDLSAEVMYEFQSSLNPTQSNGVLTTGLWKSSILSEAKIHSSGAPDGVWYWQVRAIDASGNKSAWSDVWNMTIDSKAPSAPSELKLSVTSSGLAIANNGYTNTSDVTVSWENGTTEPVTYVYKYWNDVASSTYRQSTPWSNPLANTSYAGVVNEGEGKHFFCVVARDLAGNESSCSTPYAFTYDVTAPDASIEGLVANQEVAGDVTLTGAVSDKNPMNSYFVITGPNGYRQTSLYTDGRMTHDYLWKTSSLQNGLYKVQFETRDKAGNKDGGSVTSLSIVVNNLQSMVTGENFNTHSGDDYKGVNVGFNIANFKTVSDVSVALYDDEDTLLATNTHNQNLLDLIESGVTQLSTPFIATGGTYVEEFWNLGIPTWTRNHAPTKAIVTVSGTNSAGASVSVPAVLSQLSEANGVTFESTLLVTGISPDPTGDDADKKPVIANAEDLLSPIINQFATASPLPGNNGVIAGGSLSNRFTSNNQQVSSDDSAAVLGAQTTKDDSGAPDVAKNVAAVESSPEGWKFFGVAWYWVVLLIAAIAAIWFAAARRLRQDA